MNYRTPIQYGFMIAFCGAILMLSLVGLGFLGPSAVLSGKEMTGGTLLFLMIYLFLLIGIYFVLIRQKECAEGVLSFKTAITQGILTSFSTAFFSVLLTILFYEILYPEYVNELLTALKEKMELENIPKYRVEEKLAERKTYYRTSNQCLYSFIGNFTTGASFTLLLSFFLKTQRK